MPAPRECRSCGAPLPDHGKWCVVCHEPVVRFSPRPNLDPPASPIEPAKRFRVAPAVERTGGARYSRWEKTATTFGPGAKIGVTAVLVSWLVWGFFNSFIVIWACMLAVGSKVLVDVWRKEWIPPAAEPERRPTSPAIPLDPGLRGIYPPEERPEPVRTQTPTSTWVAWIAIAVLMVGSIIAYSNGDEATRNIVMFSGLLSTGVLLIVWLVKI